MVGSQRTCTLRQTASCERGSTADYQPQTLQTQSTCWHQSAFARVHEGTGYNKRSRRKNYKVLHCTAPRYLQPLIRQVGEHSDLQLTTIFISLYPILNCQLSVTQPFRSPPQGSGIMWNALPQSIWTQKCGISIIRRSVFSTSVDLAAVLIT